MAARRIQGAKHSQQDMKDKMLTMMRPGELMSFDEEQRIAIFEMVKDGSMTIEEAHAEVKKTNPKAFEVKYIGSAPCAAKTLKATLSDELGKEACDTAVKRLKKSKPASAKVKLHCSTIAIKIVDENDAESSAVILENEPTAQIAYASVLSSDKKRVAYVTSYSRLGLVWVHIFQCGKAAEAALIAETILARKQQALEQKSLVPATGIEQMSSGVDDDEDEEENFAPLGVFNVQYLGNVSVPDIQGDEIVAQAVDRIKHAVTVQAASKRKASKGSLKGGIVDEEAAEGIVNVPVVLVISSEGIRTVEESTHDLLYNVIIKAVSYSTEIVGKKIELFAFIEVDDRRNTKTCHVYLCEKGSKGQALKICDAVCEAFKVAVAEAKARAGNPLLPMGRVREKVEGPLEGVQISRKGLTAIKAIGAGQFGKVYLASSAEGEELRAVKMLRNGATSGDKQEFLREAETMHTMGIHPNLVKFAGVAVQQRPWLVILEFCQYGDLSDVLKALARRRVPLTTQEQLNAGVQLSRGLGYLASKRFVHMDIAARNVLVGDEGVLKVADFGLTHAFDAGEEYYKQLGVLKLSIRWLAIDSFDHKLFSEKSDVWSWAVCMWEVFSYGLQPYKGNKLPEVLRMVRGGHRLEQPKTCPHDFFALMQKCWNIDRFKRPTFAALTTAIDAMVAQEAGRPLRDIGKLLNADLNKKIRQTSIRVKSKGKVTAAPGGQDAHGLIGAVDMSTSMNPQQARPKSMMIAALDAAEFENAPGLVPIPD